MRTATELACPHGSDLLSCAECVAEPSRDYTEDRRFWDIAQRDCALDCGHDPICCVCRDKPVHQTFDPYVFGDISDPEQDHSPKDWGGYR